MRKSRATAFTLVILLASVASAQKVVLRMNPPVGKSYVYTMTQETLQKMPAMDVKSTTTSTMTMKVASNTSGKITLETAINNFHMTVPPDSPIKNQIPQIEKMTSGVKVTVVMDHRGRPVSASATGNPMMQSMASGMGSGMTSMTVYPEGPVGPGSKWSGSFDMSKMMGKMMPNMTMSGGAIPISYVFQKFVVRNGKRLAQIGLTMAGKMTMTMPQGTSAIAMSGSSTILTDVATGMVVDTTGVTNTVTTFGKQSMNQKTTVAMHLKS